LVFWVAFGFIAATALACGGGDDGDEPAGEAPEDGEPGDEAGSGSPDDGAPDAATAGDTDASTGTGVAAADDCLRTGAFEPLVARDGETCHEFPVHGATGVDDTSKFEVEPGESYHEFYYEVPWEPGSLWTRFGADFDDVSLAHHYLVFTNNANGKAPGQVDRDVLGTTLFSNSTLIGGWAVGGCSTELPEDVGGQLPDSRFVMVQWHMFNTGEAPRETGSKVQVCTVPAGGRANTAGITFIGTENLGGSAGMPPGPNSFTSRCPNGSGGDVTIIGFTPHMHTIGSHMKTDLERLDGKAETIFDQPFQFDYQVGYQVSPQVVVKPGETLITTCSFLNDTGMNVGFGQSTTQEMCYQYVAYYPAGALDNGVFSLIGATNPCW
jgi:hypothetical protein